MSDDSALLMGVDLGTTGIKVVLMGLDGNQAAGAGKEYPSLTPRPGWVEQEPQTWLETCEEVIRQVLHADPGLAQRVKAIGFSGQMHGTVVLDEGKKPLRPAIIWADQRSQPQVDRLKAEVGSEEMVQFSGNPLFPGFMLATCLWLQENEPEVWARCRHLLLPKDYLRFCFTGEICTEPSDASSTAMFHIVERKWNNPFLEKLNINPARLPQVRESTGQAGVLQHGEAEKLGLHMGIPVFCGGSDQACQAVGNGLLNPGNVSCTIGTGGQIFAPVDTPCYDLQQRVHLFCHVLPARWHLESATLAAGLSLKWFRDSFEGYTYQQWADMASLVEPGAEGLLYAPYLLGERTPYMDSSVRGAFLGISIRHRREHFARALMEGVVLSLRMGLELIFEKGVKTQQIVASGGANEHPLWMQIQADIFNLPILRSVTREPAAVGAALLAGAGAGFFSDLHDAVRQTVRYDAPVEPKPENGAVYHPIFEKHQRLYSVLKQLG